MPTRRQSSAKALVAARKAKRSKRMGYEVGAAKRTPEAQLLKAHGVELAVSTEGLTVESQLGIKERRLKHRKPVTAKSRRRQKEKMKKIRVISRRDQPKWKMKVDLPKLDAKIDMGGVVSSSWIAGLEWDAEKQIAIMYLLSGWAYGYKMPFSLFQGWYYAHSKGTYWHEYIKDKYYHRYIFKVVGSVA